MTSWSCCSPSFATARTAVSESRRRSSPWRSTRCTSRPTRRSPTRTAPSKRPPRKTADGPSLTQDQVADAVGTKKSNISRLESGRYGGLTIERFIALLDAFQALGRRSRSA
ncbi:MAG: XRE family transcriptional regulator [Myxococcales bacterium]|nr:XRE family transcriptional regulator [Myxococcales bacterium]